MNKATAAYVTARYNLATELLENARVLEYNSNRTENLARAIKYMAASYPLLVEGKTKDGKDMNTKYFVYRTE